VSAAALTSGREVISARGGSNWMIVASELGRDAALFERLSWRDAVRRATSQHWLLGDVLQKAAADLDLRDGDHVSRMALRVAPDHNGILEAYVGITINGPGSHWTYLIRGQWIGATLETTISSAGGGERNPRR
jgi:hypothetical protein